MVVIKIKHGWDWIKVGDAIDKIAIKHTKKTYRKVSKALGTVADTIARSWRARVSNAPYNYRSDRPGLHSRTGGTPLEKSIRVDRVNENHYNIVILDSPSAAPPEARPPAYANYAVGSRAAPLRYKVEAIQSGLNMLKLLLKK